MAEFVVKRPRVADAGALDVGGLESAKVLEMNNAELEQDQVELQAVEVPSQATTVAAYIPAAQDQFDKS